MAVRIGKLKINIIFIFMITVFSLINFSFNLFLLFLTLALHEAGHILAIKRLGIEISAVEFLPFGVNIVALKKNLGYKAEIPVFLAGPLVNLAAAFSVFIHMRLFGCGGGALFFLSANLVYGALNLFPVKNLDGGKALERGLKLALPDHIGHAVFSAVSAVFLLILAVLALFVLMVTGYNFTLVLLCCYLFYIINFSVPNKR